MGLSELQGNTPQRIEMPSNAPEAPKAAMENYLVVVIKKMGYTIQRKQEELVASEEGAVRRARVMAKEFQGRYVLYKKIRMSEDDTTERPRDGERLGNFFQK
jgi:hypothetical protein